VGDEGIAGLFCCSWACGVRVVYDSTEAYGGMYIGVRWLDHAVDCVHVWPISQ
jgi:hypothetical protein